MKKIIIVFSLSFLLYPSVNAQYVVTDPGLTQTQIGSFLKQLLQYATEGATQYNTYQTMTKVYFDNPFAVKLIDASINGFAAQTSSWINGNFQGEPLVIANPQVYLNNIRTDSLRKDIQGVQTGGGIFSNSITGSLVRNVRTSQGSIADQTAASLPGTVKSNVCNDGTLSQMALDSLGGNQASLNNQSFASSYQAKKKELYNSLCSGDVNDKNNQKKLTTCFMSNFNCGGFDAFYDLTSNANNTEYGAVVNGSILAQKNAAEKADLATKESAGQLSYKSEKDANGNIKTPGLLVSQSAVEGAFSKLKRLESKQSDVTDIVTSFISDALDQFIGGGVGKITARVSGINSTTLDNLGDLAGNMNGVDVGSIVANGQINNGGQINQTMSATNLSIDQRNDLLKPILDKITADIASLKDAKTAYTNYLNDLNLDISNIQNSQLVGCYTSLESNIDQSSIYGGQISSWKTLTDNRITYLNNLKMPVTTSISSIDPSIKIAEKAIQDLSNSFDSKEIVSIYNTYRSKNNNIPTQVVAGTVDAKRQETQYNVTQFDTNTLQPEIKSCTTALTVFNFRGIGN